MKDYSDENSMICGLQFEEGYTDPYEQREVSYEEARQEEVDSLNDTLRAITLSQQIDKLESMIKRQAG